MSALLEGSKLTYESQWDLVGGDPVKYQEKITEYLTDICSVSGECDPLRNGGDANNAYGNAAKLPEKYGFYSSAVAILLQGWNSFGTKQAESGQRIYRSGIGMYLTQFYLRRDDRGAALWWALHTQADDILGKNKERGGEGRKALQMILGMSQEAIDKFNKVADDSVIMIEGNGGTWALANGFAEDVVVRFTLNNPEFAYLFGNFSFR